MPIREYMTDDGEIIEEVVFGVPPLELESSTGRIARLVMSMPARTPGKWGDTPGNNRRYDHGLGCVVESDKHANAIAASRGLVSMRELGDETDIRNEHEKRVSKRQAIVDAEAGEQAEYQNNLVRFGGNVAKAQVETWSAKRILSGDTVYAKGAV